MKKTRILAMTLILAMVLVGAGYAAWTDTVIVNNAVTTGDLKVEFVNDCKYPNASVFDNTVLPPFYLKAGITHGAKTTTVNIEKMYPGSTALYEAKAVNLGTIPAKFDNVKVTFDGVTSQLMKDNLMAYGQITQWRPGHLLPVRIALFTNVPLKNLESVLNSKLSGMELKVGDYFTFDVTDESKAELAEALPGYSPDVNNCIFFHLPLSVDNTLESQTAKFDITFNFKQFNK